MKHLNKNFPNCKLNKKLRVLYNNKQEINNSKLSEDKKRIKMKYIDNEIHRLWREFYMNYRKFYSDEDLI